MTPLLFRIAAVFVGFMALALVASLAITCG